MNPSHSHPSNLATSPVGNSVRPVPALDCERRPPGRPMRRVERHPAEAPGLGPAPRKLSNKRSSTSWAPGFCFQNFLAGDHFELFFLRSEDQWRSIAWILWFWWRTSFWWGLVITKGTPPLTKRRRWKSKNVGVTVCASAGSLVM